jgi:zinc transport system permease protein
MTEFLPEIFQYSFMIRAFTAGTIIAVTAPFIGIFLIMKRYSLMPDTLAHVSFAGVALGLVMAWNPILTAVLVAVIAAVGIDKLRSERNIFGESALAIFLSGSLAVAAIILSLGNNLDISILAFLFGSVSTITPTDIWIISSLGGVVIALTALFYKELFLISFDEDIAKAGGLPVKRINFILLFMTALMISLAMKVVGVLLLGALVVIPVIAALQYKLSFKNTVWLSIGISILSVYLGITSSYYFDLPSGGAIVLFLLGFFLLSLLKNKKV